MSFIIHTSLDTLQTNIQIAYFKVAYLKVQDHARFRAYSHLNSFVAFSIQGKKAISIPRSPFGSFFIENKNKTDLRAFWELIANDLRSEGVKQIEIKNPSEIYHSFPNIKDLQDLGFNILHEDLNQHIELTKEVKIHQMQERKLKALKTEGFQFRKMHEDEYEKAHKFLTVCRQAQGLQINISWDRLEKLTQSLPDSYACFGVFRDEKISALCFTVNVTEEIAYYYLPGTSPMFRNQSPMVMLIMGMVEYYKKQGFKYLDMGLSSVDGKIQETLKLFKERMGALEQEKATLICEIDG